jgi:hypothetical protein
MRPTTLPRAFEMPAMALTEPFGFDADVAECDPALALEPLRSSRHPP